MKTPVRHWLIVALAALMLLGSGCSLIYSEKRRMKRSVRAMQIAINNKEWERVGELMTEDVRYYPYQSEGEARPTSWKQWQAQIVHQKPTAFYIRVEGVEQIEDTYIARVEYQARRSDATSTQNYMWSGTMVWVKPDGAREWKCRELRDLTPIESFSS